MATSGIEAAGLWSLSVTVLAGFERSRIHHLLLIDELLLLHFI